MSSGDVSTILEDAEDRPTELSQGQPPLHPRYEIADEIGRGGMGVVMRARDRDLDRDVALKLLLHDHSAAHVRFDFEAHLTARLQHPAIVPVYDAGLLRDGTPFYAMRLVGGESLTRRIARCTTAEQRLALLPIVLTVAEAAAYAHTHDVIHRDLKPDNVLIGEFGETMVLDWGVAKHREVLAEHDTDGDDEPSHAVGLTSAGAIIGTPAYMPPEQADGATIDARADVYAIGAILYHALSGGPPFRGSASEVIAKLAFGPPPPLPAALPLDLRAIVETAMARDPAHRYATALELAADLRRFIAGQMVAAHRYTWFERAAHVARRHRVLVSVTAVFLGVGVAGALFGVRSVLVERDVAEQERATAEAERIAAEDARASEERGRAAAEDLVAFMLDDLQGRLARVGQLALLEDTGLRVEDYYAAIEDPSDEQPTRRRVDALVLLGRAQMIRGAGPEAIASLERAVAAARALEGSAPLADALRWHAMAMRDAGRHDDAVKDLVEARDRADVAGDELLRARVRLELARTHLRLSRVDEARPDAVAGLALARVALDEHRDDGEAYVVLGAAVVVSATVLALGGEIEDAIARVAEVEDTLRARAAADPSDVRIVVALADVLRLHARFEGRRGGADVARPMAREALALTERLVAGDPSNLQWQRLLAEAVDIDATLSGQARDLDAAVAGYRRLAEIRTAILDRNPASLDAQSSLGMAEDRVGAAHYESGRFADAAVAFARAELRLVPLAVANPEGDISATLVRTRLHHADALVRLHRTEDAIAMTRLALAGAETLRAAHPEHLEHSLRLARARTLLARLVAPGDESVDLAQQAVVLLRAHDERGELRNADDALLYDEARGLASAPQ